MGRQGDAVAFELCGGPIRHGTPTRLRKAGRLISLAPSKGYGGKAPERNGLGAFLLADYPYRLGYGGQSLSAA